MLVELKEPGDSGLHCAVLPDPLLGSLAKSLSEVLVINQGLELLCELLSIAVEESCFSVFDLLVRAHVRSERSLWVRTH